MELAYFSGMSWTLITQAMIDQWFTKAAIDQSLVTLVTQIITHDYYHTSLKE